MTTHDGADAEAKVEAKPITDVVRPTSVRLLYGVEFISCRSSARSEMELIARLDAEAARAKAAEEVMIEAARAFVSLAYEHGWPHVSTGLIAALAAYDAAKATGGK